MSNENKTLYKDLSYKSLLLFVAISSVVFVGIRGLKAEAAQFFLGGAAQEVGVNQQLRVDLFINTEDKEVNAFGGVVTFPRNLLELKEVRDGNSIVNFWVDKPRIAADSNKLVFSGITPGGYNGKEGLIFSLIFEAKNEGGGVIEIEEGRSFLNDGQGIELKTDSSGFSFVAIRDSIRGDSWTMKDTEPPETFRPEIAKDESVFDGKWFLVFATQDKGSGVDHYEVREGWRGEFRIAESPYPLQSQNLDKKIFVKAVDKDGNKRIETLYPPNYKPWYQNYWIIAILILIVTAIIVGAILRKILWQKSARSR